MKSRLIKIGLGILCFIIVGNSNPDEGSQRSINGLLIFAGAGLIIWGVFFSIKKNNKNTNYTNSTSNSNNSTQPSYNTQSTKTNERKFITHFAFNGYFCYEYEYLVDGQHISYPTARMITVNNDFNLDGKISRRKKGETNWEDMGPIKYSVQETGGYVLLNLK